MKTDSFPYTLGDYFDVLRRRWVYLATLLPGAIVVAIYLAYSLPPMFRSSATILLEPSSIPADMVRTTVTSFADQHIELVRRRVITTESLARVVEKVDPYPDRADMDIRDKAREIGNNMQVQRVDPITLEPRAESTAFSIHYFNPDPALARAVTEQLAEMFLEHNRETRTERARETYAFLLEQSREANQRIQQLEQELADFQTEYGAALPEVQDRNVQALERTERELDALERQIRTTMERRSLLQLQLAELNPYLFEPGGGWRTELGMLQGQLAEARQRYTEDHPDVRRLIRSIEALSARVQATESGGNVRPPDNPEYLRFASQLQTVSDELGALEASAERARQQIQAFEQRLEMAPSVQREYRQLLREHEIAQQRYREIQNNLSQASLAEVLEAEQQGQRFTLIRTANEPSSPDSPNRIGVILLGMVFGGATSIGLATLREVSDPTLRSMRDLSLITDIKPIGAVPVLLNQQDLRKRIAAWAVAGAAVLGGMILLASAFT